MPNKKMRLREGYHMPMFNTGHVIFTIEDIDGTQIMRLSISVKGITNGEQQAHFNQERMRIAKYVGLMNDGIDSGLGARAELAVIA